MSKPFRHRRPPELILPTALWYWRSLVRWILCESYVGCRSSGDARPGTQSCDPAVAGHMSRVVSEQRLYTQLSYLHRMLDAKGASSRAGGAEAASAAQQKLGGIRAALDAGAAAVERLRNHSAYRWVDLKVLSWPRETPVGPVR